MAFSQLPRLLLAEEDPTPSPFPSPPVYSKASFRPSIAIIIAVLTTMFSLTFLLLLYAKHCKRQAIGSSSSGAYGGGGGPSAVDRRNSGVGRSVVESLPVFRFASLTGPHRHGLECAVCLTRFEPTEILRLLPKCKHGFHVECVDVWLEAHSTCPLCRVRVDPEDVLLVLDPKPEPPPPEPVTVSDAVVSLPFVRRISGRHSSAGERGAGLVKIVVHRRSEGGDGTAAAAVSLRKDRTLLTESTSVVERVEFERRYSHRINVVLGGDGTPLGERWSDLKPSDILHLRSEMIITPDSGRSVNNLRSVSEITGMSRFREGTKWLGFKAKRTGMVTGLTPSDGGGAYPEMPTDLLPYLRVVSAA